MKIQILSIISTMIFIVPSHSQETYEHCFNDRSSSVCRAYLAGIESEKQRLSSNEDKPQTVRHDEKEDSLLKRALKQRAGGRYNASTFVSEDEK